MIDDLIDEKVVNEFDREQLEDLKSHIEGLLETYGFGDVTGLTNLIRVSHLLHRDFRDFLADEIDKILKGEFKPGESKPLTKEQLRKRYRNLMIHHYYESERGHFFPGTGSGPKGRPRDEIIHELMEKHSLAYETIYDILKKKEG